MVSIPLCLQLTSHLTPFPSTPSHSLSACPPTRIPTFPPRNSSLGLPHYLLPAHTLPPHAASGTCNTCPPFPQSLQRCTAYTYRTLDAPHTRTLRAFSPYYRMALCACTLRYLHYLRLFTLSPFYLHLLPPAGTAYLPCQGKERMGRQAGPLGARQQAPDGHCLYSQYAGDTYTDLPSCCAGWTGQHEPCLGAPHCNTTRKDEGTIPTGHHWRQATLDMDSYTTLLPYFSV